MKNTTIAHKVIGLWLCLCLNLFAYNVRADESRTDTQRDVSTEAKKDETSEIPKLDDMTTKEASPPAVEKKEAKEPVEKKKKPKTKKAKQEKKVEASMFVIETQYGPIEVEMYPKEAPKTVKRISELVGKGFYNGLKFHRVVPGFVVQGGDPQGTGVGGSGVNIPAEFNEHEHVEGTVAMARATDPNSADSQFYISLGRHPHLDRNYTVFGKVTKGIDAVKKIKQGDVMTKVYMKTQ